MKKRRRLARMTTSLAALFVLVSSLQTSANAATFFATQDPQPSSAGGDFEYFSDPVPSITTFRKYNDSKVDYYTGSPIINIPIYTYKDNDFEFPISITYSSDGYKPGQLNDVLGQGWVLNVGGEIIREVRGLPDDFFGRIKPLNGIIPFGVGGNDQYPNDPHNPPEYYNPALTEYYGAGDFVRMWDMLRRHNNPNSAPPIKFETSTDYLPYRYYADWPTGILDPTKTARVNYETTPDIFRFCMPGYSGEFSLVNLYQDENVVKELGERYRPRAAFFNTSGEAGSCDIVNIKVTDNHEIGELCISTGDGYYYTFGGDGLSRHSKSAKSRPGNPGWRTIDGDVFKTNWPLTQIKAPNGNSINLHFRDHGSDVNNNNNYYTNSCYNLGKRLSSFNATPYHDDVMGDWIDHYHPGRYDTTDSAKREVYTSYLGSVCFGEITARFDYKGGLLKSISILGDNPDSTQTLLKKCEFIYYKDSLIEAEISDEGIYRFMYYDVNIDGSGKKFPGKNTSSIDRWGYYNLTHNHVIPGEDTSNDPPAIFDRHIPRPFPGPYSVVPDTTYTPRYSGIIPEGEDRPSAKDAMLGMLKTIIYPTGGATEFEYEGHDYSHTLVRHHDAIDVVGMLECSISPAGGLRVKKIVDYSEFDTREVATVRKFVYRMKNPDGQLISSGNSLRFPRYMSGSTGNVKTISPLSWSKTKDEAHIEYSCVEEWFMNGAHNTYYFSNYLTHPDMSQNESDGEVIELLRTGSQKFEREPYSCHSLRGKQLMTEIYDSENKLLQRDKYTYNFTPRLKNTHKETLFNRYCYYTHGVNYYNPILTGQESHEFFYENGRQTSARTSKTTLNYNYLDQVECVKQYDLQQNSSAQPKIKGTKFYRLSTNCETIKNLNDIPIPWAGDENVIAAINSTSRTWNGIILQEETFLEDPVSGQQYVTGGKRNVYTYKELKTNPNRGYLDTRAKEGLALVSEVRLLTPGTPIPMGSVIPEMYKTELSMKYNNYGNIIETTSRSGLKTCYIWGYGGLFPIAVIGNISLESLKYDYGLVDIETKPLEGDTLPSSLISGSDKMITTYKFNPHVGLESVTDPSGRTVNYTYGEDLRLKEITDDKGFLLESYEYNIKK